MLDRYERPLRMLVLALAAVLVFQWARALMRGDPLAHLLIPAVPTLAASTNAPATNAPSTNAAATVNASNAMTNTNAASSNHLAATTKAALSNAVANSHSAMATNKPAGSATNVAAITNTLATNAPGGTNAAASAHTNETATVTNSAAGENKAPRAGRRGPRAGAMAGMPGGMPHLNLPPAVQSRVDKIIESEILGPVIHPQPMALIGIADDDAFIRAPDGQTGPVKVGHELGGIKLLRIGINRVLIEENGEKKELTVFDGLGGVSLLPKTNDVPTNSPSLTNKALASKPKETL